jgi:hypothetical protein
MEVEFQIFVGFLGFIFVKVFNGFVLGRCKMKVVWKNKIKKQYRERVFQIFG